MISEIIEKTHITDFYIIFNQQQEKANHSVKFFQEQFQKEEGQFCLENFGNPNKFKLYINETFNKGKSKQNISSIIEKYSKNKQLESSNIFMQNCQREPFLTIIVLSKEEFISFENIINTVITTKEEDCKTLLILEEVKELIFAQAQFIQYQQEFDQFILELQLIHKVDIINTKSSKQTFNEILQCMLCGLQIKKKKNKIPCLFRERAEQSLFKAENAGIVNQYELMWLGMLTQIPGISDIKARAIVLRYPSITSLVRAYEDTPLDQRPYLLSDIDVINGIVQQTSKKLGNKISEQLYTLFSIRDPEYKLLD